MPTSGVEGLLGYIPKSAWIWVKPGI